MKGSRYISLILAASIVLGPATSFAQGFDFGAEEEETESVGGDTSDDGSAGMDFAAEEVIDTTDNSQRSIVAVVALPGPNMPPERRKSIEKKMNEVLKDVPSNLYVGSDVVVDELQTRGMLECVREPICLGAVGVNNRIDQILMAQLSPSPSGGETLTIDLFEAKDKLTLRYAKKEGLKTNAEILDAIKPLLYNIFEVREARPSRVAVRDNSSLISPIIAWTSLGLALGAAGAGGYFTYAAKTADDKLKKEIADKKITQVQAKQDNEAVKNKATLSYIFYGLAGGLAAVSAVFFILDVGADVSSDQQASIKNLQLVPLFSTDGAGISAGFNF